MPVRKRNAARRVGAMPSGLRQGKSVNHRRFMLAAVAALAFSPLVVASPSGAAPSESDAVAQAVPELP